MGESSGMGGGPLRMDSPSDKKSCTFFHECGILPSNSPSDGAPAKPPCGLRFRFQRKRSRADFAPWRGPRKAAQMGPPQKRLLLLRGEGGTAERMSFRHRRKRMSAACADDA